MEDHIVASWSIIALKDIEGTIDLFKMQLIGIRRRLSASFYVNTDAGGSLISLINIVYTWVCGIISSRLHFSKTCHRNRPSFRSISSSDDDHVPMRPSSSRKQSQQQVYLLLDVTSCFHYLLATRPIPIQAECQSINIYKHGHFDIVVSSRSPLSKFSFTQAALPKRVR